MKKRRNVDFRNAFVLILFIVIGILLVAGFSKLSLWNKITGKALTEPASVTASVNNVAPVIFSNNLDLTTNIALLGGTTRQVNISFKVQDNNGFNDINATSLGTYVNISRAEVTRQSAPESCIKSPGGTPKRADINCSVLMQFFDANATDWTVVVSVGDIGGLRGSNAARTITVDLLKDISITTTPPSSPTTLNFTTLIPGATDQGAGNDPINITNNGNYQGKIAIDGFNLTNGIDVIPIFNFTVHNISGQECILPSEGGTATQLTDAASGDLITNSSLPRGPSGSNVEQLFFCADSLPDPLSSGVYESKDTTTPIPWVILLP